MKWLKWLFWIVVSVALLWLALTVCGCTESQRQAVDVIAADANQLGSDLRKTADNPLLPEPVQLGLEVVGIAVMGAAAAWAKMRPKVKLLTETAGSIVQAVEESSERTQLEVKGRVREQMTGRRIYPAANKLVDSLKAK